MPHWQTVGVLESIWLLTQTNAPRGDLGRMPDDDIAAGIEWNGSAESLIGALVDAGFVVRHNRYRLVVHDWHDHAPTWLKGAMAKNGKSFVTMEEPASDTEQVMPPSPSTPAAESPATDAAQSDLHCGDDDNDGTDKVRPRKKRQAKKKDDKGPIDYPEDFEQLWAVYPKRDNRLRGKASALAEWKKIPAAEHPSVIDAARRYACSSDALRNFARDPERFLKSNWWRDWATPDPSGASRPVATGDLPQPIDESATRPLTQAELDAKLAALRGR